LHEERRLRISVAEPGECSVRTRPSHTNREAGALGKKFELSPGNASADYADYTERVLASCGEETFDE